MSQFAAVLRTEIARIAKKEAKALTDPLRKQVTALRRENAAQKRVRAQLERRVKELGRALRGSGAASEKATEESTQLRFSAARFKRQRERSGLSAADFGKLIGCSGQSVYGWETGKTRPRQAQLARIAALRGLGKRAAQARLATLAAPKTRKRKAR